MFGRGDSGELGIDTLDGGVRCLPIGIQFRGDTSASVQSNMSGGSSRTYCQPRVSVCACGRGLQPSAGANIYASSCASIADCKGPTSHVLAKQHVSNTWAPFGNSIHLVCSPTMEDFAIADVPFAGWAILKSLAALRSWVSLDDLAVQYQSAVPILAAHARFLQGNVDEALRKRACDGSACNH